MATPRNDNFPGIASGATTLRFGRNGSPSGGGSPGDTGSFAYMSGAVAHQWVAIPGSAPSANPQLLPAVADGRMGAVNCLVDNWCGAGLINGQFLVHGGGHGDYAGNEVLSINVHADAPVWVKRRERTGWDSLLGGSNYYLDGRPTSRHTYRGMWGMMIDGSPRLIQFCWFMGNACYNQAVPWPGTNSASITTANINSFNLETNDWDAPIGVIDSSVIPNLNSETALCQDPATGDMYAVSSDNNVYFWRKATGACGKLADFSGSSQGGGAPVFDAVNRRVSRFAGRASAKHLCCDADTGAAITPTLIGPAASDISGLSGDNHGWGVAHDTKRNNAYLLTTAGVLLRVRLADFHVERITTTGAVLPASATGGQTWGRMMYDPVMDAVVVLPKWASPVHVMLCGD